MGTVGGSQVTAPPQASASAAAIFTELGKASGGGDRVVRCVSETVGASRGEEFALMFPEPAMVDTALVAQRSQLDETRLVLQPAMETEGVC